MDACKFCDLAPGQKGEVYGNGTRLVRSTDGSYYVEKDGDKFYTGSGIDWAHYCPMCGRKLDD